MLSTSHSFAESPASTYTSFADLYASQESRDAFQMFLNLSDEESTSNEQTENIAITTSTLRTTNLDLCHDEDDLRDDISVHSAQSLTLLNLPLPRGYDSPAIPTSYSSLVSKVSRTTAWVFQQLGGVGSSESILTEEELAMSWGPSPIEHSDDMGWSDYVDSDASSEVESSSNTNSTDSVISSASVVSSAQSELSEASSRRSGRFSTPPSSIGRYSDAAKRLRRGPLPARQRKSVEARRQQQQQAFAEEFGGRDSPAWPFPGELKHRKPTWIESKLPESLQITKQRLERAQFYHDRAMERWAAGLAGCSWSNIMRWDCSMESDICSYSPIASVVELHEEKAVAQLEFGRPRGGVARKLKSMRC